MVITWESCVSLRSFLYQKMPYLQQYGFFLRLLFFRYICRKFQHHEAFKRPKEPTERLPCPTLKDL